MLQKHAHAALIGVPLFLLAVGICFYSFGIKSPAAFPGNALLSIESGESVGDIVETLERQHIVRSGILAALTLRLLGDDRSIVAGDYYFSYPENLFSVLRRLTEGEHGLSAVRITLPEGMTRSAMAAVLAQRLPRFDAERFLALTEGEEGSLFPDTYFFLPTADEAEVAARLRSTFEQKMKPVRETLKEHGGEPTFADLLTMASILEGEAQTLEDRKIVAGILWERLNNDMPLQVDAPFVYLLGKNTYELTAEDLAVESPYNTYLSKGLPPTPISNPGLEALEAALWPTPSSYVFFLSDEDGTMYYSETFEEHVAKKRIYIGG